MNTSNSGLILSIFLCFVFVSFASFSQKYFPDKYKAVGQTFTSVRIASAWSFRNNGKKILTGIGLKEWCVRLPVKVARE